MLNLKSKPALFVLTCLIVASFSLGDILSNNIGDLDFSNENVGWVGDKPIKNIEFLKYKQYLSQKNPNIKNSEVIQKIGERSAILQYAKNQLNITILDQDVINEIKKDKLFFIDDKFDSKIYLSHLNELNLTPLEYEKNIRENLELKELLKITDIRNKSKLSMELLSDSLFQILEVELFEMNYQYQKDFKIDEYKLAKLYEDNKEEFKTNVLYEIEISKYLKDDDFINKEWLKYKENPEEIYDIKQILVNTNSDVEKINELLKSNTFEDLAKKYSIDKSSSDMGGLIKGLKKSELTPDFKNGLENESPDNLFLAKSGLGYHIVKRERKIGKNISITEFKNYFEKEINDNFLKNVKEGLVKSVNSEKIEVYEKSINELFTEFDNNGDIPLGSETFVGGENYIEKVVLVTKNLPRNLDIKNLNDYPLIVNIYKNNIKLNKAVILSENIENIYDENKYNWIMKRDLEINKNSELPKELKDSIYTTKIGDKGDLLIGNKYFVYIVKSKKSLKTKEDDFSMVMERMYNFESGYILINEAKDLYPIKISKKIINI